MTVVGNIAGRPVITNAWFSIRSATRTAAERLKPIFPDSSQYPDSNSAFDPEQYYDTYAMFYDDCRSGVYLYHEYIHSDICDWIPDRRYDLVFSTYIFNYACNRVTLENMVKKLSECLNDHGRLIIVLDILGYRQASEYGHELEDFAIHHTAPLQAYDSFRLTLKTEAPGGQDFELRPSHIDLEELWHLLTRAGFTNIQLQTPAFSPEAAKHMPLADIVSLTAYPPITLVTARL